MTYNVFGGTLNLTQPKLGSQQDDGGSPFEGTEFQSISNHRCRI